MLWLIRHAMCALYPATDAWPGIADTGVDAYLKQWRREAPFLIILGTLLGALLFALTPLITIGVPAPSFFLTRRALDRHANKIGSHKLYLLRQAIFVLKLTAGNCWGAHPEVRRRLNLAPYPADPGTVRTR